MYIEPNTNIKLLHNVPLDNTYEHTILFSNANAQANYFASLTKHNLTAQSYQRVNRGVAKVGLSADACYDCNYMMFQNTNYGTKWFYAFIKSVEYINNAVCEIRFEIDVMQTWLFDVTLKECFVEREHVSDDRIGANTVDEKLSTGEYVIQNQTDHVSGNACALYALPSVMTDDTVINNVFTPLIADAQPIPDGSTSVGGGFLDTLRAFNDTPERIAMLTMVASDMVTDGGSLTDFHKSFSVGRSITGFSFNGENYVPKNNKLYCYPYCMFTIDNYNGGIEHFRWEDFNDVSNVNFAWEGCVAPKPCMECFPIDYKGLSPSETQVNTAQQYTVIYDNFPMCPYPTDTFKQWASSSLPKQVVNTQVQTAVAIGLASLAKESAPTLIGQASAGFDLSTIPLSAIFSALRVAGSVKETMIDYEYHKVHSQSIGGVVGNAGMNWSAGRIGFRSTCYQIRPEYAKMIDDYFTKYGYKINRLKVPNISSRPHWNYVKTRDCVLQGNAPADDINTICSIYNKGVTFWKNGNEIGNYSLNNSPT